MVAWTMSPPPVPSTDHLIRGRVPDACHAQIDVDGGEIGRREIAHGYGVRTPERGQDDGLEPVEAQGDGVDVPL